MAMLKINKSGVFHCTILIIIDAEYFTLLQMDKYKWFWKYTYIYAYKILDRNWVICDFIIYFRELYINNRYNYLLNIWIINISHLFHSVFSFLFLCAKNRDFSSYKNSSLSSPCSVSPHLPHKSTHILCHWKINWLLMNCSKI